MKNGLVLGGGGPRGAYQIGAIKALHELGYKYNVVTGTSVGAVNATLLADHKFDLLKQTWENMDYNTIFSHKFRLKNKVLESVFSPFIGGYDLIPLEKLIKQHLNPKTLKLSNIEAGVVYTSSRLKYCPIQLNKVSDELICDYILASCSAFPFYKRKIIKGKKCLDGCYSDNLPVKLAMEMGANKIIAIDIVKFIRKRVDTSEIDYLYISPSKRLKSIFNFDTKVSKEAIELGYNDIMDRKNEILEFINK